MRDHALSPDKKYDTWNKPKMNEFTSAMGLATGNIEKHVDRKKKIYDIIKKG